MAIRIAKPSLPPEYFVDNRVYTDPHLFRQEIERIFLRVWNFVCHASEDKAEFVDGLVAAQAGALKSTGTRL